MKNPISVAEQRFAKAMGLFCHTQTLGTNGINKKDVRSAITIYELTRTPVKAAPPEEGICVMRQDPILTIPKQLTWKGAFPRGHLPECMAGSLKEWPS
jgi:hypothetical protein